MQLQNIAIGVVAGALVASSTAKDHEYKKGLRKLHQSGSWKRL